MIVAYPKSNPSPMMFTFPLSLSCALTRSPLNPSGRLSSTPCCSFPSAVSRKKRKENLQPFSCQVGTCFSDELSSCHTRAPACHISPKIHGSLSSTHPGGSLLETLRSSVETCQRSQLAPKTATRFPLLLAGATCAAAFTQNSCQKWLGSTVKTCSPQRKPFRHCYFLLF